MFLYYILYYYYCVYANNLNIPGNALHIHKREIGVKAFVFIICIMHRCLNNVVSTCLIYCWNSEVQCRKYSRLYSHDVYEYIKAMDIIGHKEVFNHAHNTHASAFMSARMWYSSAVCCFVYLIPRTSILCMADIQLNFVSKSNDCFAIEFLLLCCLWHNRRQIFTFTAELVELQINYHFSGRKRY